MQQLHFDTLSYSHFQKITEHYVGINVFLYPNLAEFRDMTLKYIISYHPILFSPTLYSLYALHTPFITKQQFFMPIYLFQHYLQVFFSFFHFYTSKSFNRLLHISICSSSLLTSLYVLLYLAPFITSLFFQICASLPHYYFLFYQSSSCPSFVTFFSFFPLPLLILFSFIFPIFLD